MAAAKQNFICRQAPVLERAGARALPELNSDGQVVSFIIVDGGYGYSEAVKAIAVGIHAEKFFAWKPFSREWEN